VVLSSYGKDQQQTLQSIYTDEAKELEQIPAFRNFLKLFVTKEIVSWPLHVGPGFTPDALIKEQSLFQDQPKWWDRLQQRTNEHNVRVVANWYTQIRTDRFAELLEIDSTELEKTVSRMVCIREEDAGDWRFVT